MIKKIAINVFYNLGIILSLFGIFWSFENGKYPLIALFVVTAGFFLYLKIRLVKETRNMFRK
ncbi:DUF6358 family protein [Pedobacter psychroterrae]|uniref:Uncharacterized protein n=1 Tax=Pedobacter psychroterrae TaxID=2530453 RepID=A0A4R0NQE0_9SPHI|nr:DUF6358 family protein [Pedobacter psychroterrae]TCD03251.1 hypothetical protein EZ437_04580 [Pedobacter psychroterrae]